MKRKLLIFTLLVIFSVGVFRIKHVYRKYELERVTSISIPWLKSVTAINHWPEPKTTFSTNIDWNEFDLNEKGFVKLAEAEKQKYFAIDYPELRKSRENDQELWVKSDSKDGTSWEAHYSLTSKQLKVIVFYDI